jgi:hypothetical protein
VAWTWADIDALAAGDNLYATYTDKDNYANCTCYQLWAEVTYGVLTKKGGLFVFHG